MNYKRGHMTTMCQPEHHPPSGYMDGVKGSMILRAMKVWDLSEEFGNKGSQARVP